MFFWSRKIRYFFRFRKNTKKTKRTKIYNVFVNLDIFGYFRNKYKSVFRNKKSYSENGGARNEGMPQASRLTWHWRWAYWVLHVRRRDTVMATAAATNDKVRNWQSTHEWMVVVSSPRCPWQWCCTHSLQLSSNNLVLSCTWIDDRISIGTNTANITHDAICLFFFTFTGAKLRKT